MLVTIVTILVITRLLQVGSKYQDRCIELESIVKEYGDRYGAL